MARLRSLQIGTLIFSNFVRYISTPGQQRPRRSKRRVKVVFTQDFYIGNKWRRKPYKYGYAGKLFLFPSAGIKRKGSKQIVAKIMLLLVFTFETKPTYLVDFRFGHFENMKLLFPLFYTKQIWKSVV